MRQTVTIIILWFIGIQFCLSQGLPISNEKFIWNSDDTISHRKVNFDPLYFVLGTLSDYGGRFRYVDREKQVDQYYSAEKPLVEFLEKYITEKLKIRVETKFDGFIKMYSDSLSKKLNSFYDTNDKLIDSLLKSKKQICSFIAGVYYRNGEKIDTMIYKIQLANSPKHQNCYELLKQLGCNRILFEYFQGMPSQYVLYFKPTNELENYLFTIEEENVNLNKSLNRTKMKYFIKGSTNKFKDELEKAILDFRNKEASRIKDAFNIPD